MLSKDPVKRGLNSYHYCNNDPVNYTDPTGEIVNILFPIGLGVITGGASAFANSAISQLISGEGFNLREPQAGRGIGYSIEDGRIHVDNGAQKVDFVIDMDGNLHIGSGHSYIANGADVQAAGTMKINSQGYVKSIMNGSGHYAPTVEQGRSFPNLLNELGIRTKNAWLELGDYSFTPSGYVDVTKSSTIVEQLK